jgi:hypothetical protein
MILVILKHEVIMNGGSNNNDHNCTTTNVYLKPATSTENRITFIYAGPHVVFAPGR